MAEQWERAKASEVRPGERVRTADGTELTATRVETIFLGRTDMIAFIEDTSARWLKRPVPVDADVERLVTG
jgi:hypothetical protein